MHLTEVFTVSTEAVDAISCLVFILVYATMAEWHKRLDGKLMMMVAAGNIFEAVASIALAGHWGDTSVDWLRMVRATGALAIGLFFIVMTVRVWMAQTGRLKT